MRDIKFELLCMEIKRQEEERKNPQYATKERIEEIKRKERERNGIYEIKDVKPDTLVGGWFLYIIVMIGGLIFVDYIYLAIFATIYFFSWRHNEIEKANGRKYDD